MSDNQEINSSILFNMFECPFGGFEPGWNPRQYIVFNILASEFSNDSTKTIMKFSDLKSCASQTILHVLASIVERKDLGTSYVNNSNYSDHYYCAQGIPKTVQIFEELRSSDGIGIDRLGNEENNFLGFRVWLFINDPTYDLLKAFSDLITANSRKKTKKKMEIHESIDSPDALSNLWSQYLHKFGQNSMDDIHTDENSIDNPESKINPFKILTISNAIKLQPINVCEEQSNENSYFDTDEGINAENFLKKFPVPQFTYRFNTLHFNPKGLSIAPVPNCIRNFILNHKNVIEQNTKQKEQAQEKLDFENDVNERDNLLDEIYQADNNIQRSADEIDSISRNLKTGQNENIGLLSYKEQEERFKQRNQFMRLAEKNEKKLNQIQENFQPCTEEYEIVMDDFRTEGLEEFWKTFMTADNITPAVKSVRDWLNGLPSEDWWYENNQFISNLSPYGNMIVRMTIELDKLFRVETNFQLILIAFAVNYCALRFSWKLRPNLLLTGEGGTGKSFLMNLIEELSAPGTVMNATHITEQAFNTDQDISDVCLHLEEIPGSMLGIDKYGNKISSDNTLKNRMSSAKSISFQFARDSKKRQTEMSVNRNMISTIAATNEKTPNNKDAIMQRFLHFPVKKMTRLDIDPKDIIFLQEYLEDKPLKKIIKHGYQLKHAYLLIIEKAIESDVLPDIDMSVAKDVSRWVFTEMENEGIPLPSRRKIDMYFDICRIYTILYAIDIEFFSELGDKYRQIDPDTGLLKNFNVQYLKNLIKYFQCTEEIAIHILTLMEDIWIPKLKQDIVNTIAKTLLPCTCQDSYSQWKPVFDNNDNGNNPPTPFRKNYTRMNTRGEPEIDLRYIQLTDSSFTMMANKIQSNILDKPSSNDILSNLMEMKCDFIKVKPKEVMPIPISKDDFGNIIYEQTLVDIEDAQKQSINCVIFEEHPQNKRIKLLSISIDLINRNLSGILKKCIKKATEHLNEKERTLISGTNYNRKTELLDPENGRLLPDIRGETFCNVFDVIELKQGKHIKVIENNYAYSLLDSAALYSRIGERYNKIMEIKKINQTSGWILDAPIESIHMKNYWAKQGLPIEDAQIAYPTTTKHVLWKQRQNDERYKKIEKLVIRNYPEEYIISKEKQGKKSIEKLKKNEKRYEKDTRLIEFENASIYSEYYNYNSNSNKMSVDTTNWTRDVTNYLPKNDEESNDIYQADDSNIQINVDDDDDDYICVNLKKQKDSFGNPNPTMISSYNDEVTHNALNRLLERNNQSINLKSRRKPNKAVCWGSGKHSRDQRRRFESFTDAL